MKGRTHVVGGAVIGLSAFIVKKESGQLLPSEVISPALQFITVYVSSIYGSKWCDNDLHWESSPLHDPVSYVQNKILHIFNKSYARLDASLTSREKSQSRKYKFLKFFSCSHRSWQTHSELTLAVILFLIYHADSLFKGGSVDPVLWSLILQGFCLGVISHIFLDLITVVGVPFFLGEVLKVFYPNSPIPTDLRLVPDIEYFSMSKGGGGAEWEEKVRYGLLFTQYVLLAVIILYIFGISVPQMIGK